MKGWSHSYSPLPVDSSGPRKLSTASVLIPIAFLCSLVIVWFNAPKIVTFPITSRYPKCGHIVLVSERRHGSTWFISNADDCLSVNGSYGRLNRDAEIWNHGNVKEIAVQDAIDLVRFKTSVKLFPPALYKHEDDVRTFLEAMRELRVPVFVLRRNLERAYASLQKARKSKVWNADNTGAVVDREIEDARFFPKFKNETETYFDTMKTLLADMGIKWDEIEYETILSQRLILGETLKCYVRNCNFNW